MGVEETNTTTEQVADPDRDEQEEVKPQIDKLISKFGIEYLTALLTN